MCPFYTESKTNHKTEQGSEPREAIGFPSPDNSKLFIMLIPQRGFFNILNARS